MQLLDLFLKFPDTGFEFLAHVVDGSGDVAFLPFGSDLLAGCGSEAVEGVLIEFGPMLVLHFVRGIKVVEAFARMCVQGCCGEAALAIVEAVRIEAEQVDSF